MSTTGNSPVTLLPRTSHHEPFVQASSTTEKRSGRFSIRQWLVLLALLGGWLLGASGERVAAQGALTTGWLHTGTIAPVGDSDAWTFSATTGDRIVVRVGEISQTNNFTLRIRLQNPNAVLVGMAQNSAAAEIAFTATNTGILHGRCG